MKLYELIEKLRSLDEVSILELLEITTDDLLDAFSDRVEDNQNRIYRYFDQ